MIHRVFTPVALSAAVLATTPAFAASSGMLEKHASTSVEDTVSAFKAVLEKKGATVFATVDHAKGAAKVEMPIPPATVVIFGNPKIGTPIMQLAPSMGLDLPLKALFFEDEGGKTKILYPDLNAVASRHGIDGDDPAVQKAVKALDGLTSAIADK